MSSFMATFQNKPLLDIVVALDNLDEAKPGLRWWLNDMLNGEKCEEESSQGHVVRHQSVIACEPWDPWWFIYEVRPYEWDVEDELQSKIIYMSAMARRIQFSWRKRPP